MSLQTTTTTARVEWWLEAACRGRPTSWWFPDDDFTAQVALTICAHCPVRAECLRDAVDLEAGHPVAAGIRGGKTASQRAAMLRPRSAQPPR